MPVLPDEGSIRVWPGSACPSFSASSTIDRAIRSFTDPPGFCPSSLIRMRTLGFGLSGADVHQRGVADQLQHRAERSSDGVVAPAADRPPGHRGQDRDLVGVLDRGVEPER